jgi:hypothetical protein
VNRCHAADRAELRRRLLSGHVFQDFPYNVRTGDSGDHAQPTAAVRTDRQTDREHAAQRYVTRRSIQLIGALGGYPMAAFGGMAAGSWLWGNVATFNGVSVALHVGAGVTFVCVLLGRWLTLPQTEAVNLDPLRVWQAPDIAVPMQPQTGPVVVSVEYIIDEADIVEFLGAMAERRRIRRRDGARYWTLLRDLADVRIWVERYETATWLDYIRHNNRLTHDDAIIPERLRALHRGDEGPRVRRMIERQTGSLPDGYTPGARDLTEPLTDPTRSS